MSNLRKIADKFRLVIAQEAPENYGGKGKFELPSTHKAGMPVPKGGSSCANCKFGQMQDNGPHCTNVHWVEWNGGESRLPVDDPSTYCSDWYEPKEPI